MCWFARLGWAFSLEALVTKMTNRNRISQFHRIAIICLSALLLAFFASKSMANQGDNVTGEVKRWLDRAPDKRPEFQKQRFSSKSLTKEQAAQIQKFLWNDYLQHSRIQRKSEWKSKKLQIDNLEMKFEYKVHGEKPNSGRSLFISMHGGGGAPARVNEQQWKNQIRLYQPDEGVYLAPRAPTDTWNLWHQSHIDQFFQRIIQDAILFEDVDPNRVYLMGYSAGGDGVYQLAPRMADSLAAAAMMAGHPNDATALGLRNIGFTIHMGGRDSAYKRNQVARQWKQKLATLQQEDPEGYQHEVVIHENHGHWMNRDDAVAVPWMSKFTRNPRPKKIVWCQSSVIHDQFYWLGVQPDKAKKGDTLVVSRNGQTFKFEKIVGCQSPVTLLLNDQLVDLDQPVVIEIDGVKRQRMVSRNAATIYQSIQNRGDPELIYSALIRVPVPTKSN